MKDGKDTTIHISSGTIIRSILFILLIAALFFLRDVVLVVMTAVVIASAIEPITKWFVDRKIPRVASVLLVYVTTSLFFLSIFYFFVPTFLNEASSFLATLPRYADSINLPTQTGGDIFSTGPKFVAENFSLQEIISNIQSSFSNVSEGFVKTVSTIFGGVLSFVLIIVFSFYFSVQETGVDDFLRIITPARHQHYVLDLWRRSKIKIGRWMQGQLMLALIVGILVYLGLTVLGIRYALLLAVLAGIFELIPVFGAILAAIPGVLIAFVDGGITLGLIVIGLYLIIQQFENHLIYPLVVTKVVGVPPLLVILALIVGAKFAGFLGIILSVPIAAIIQELVKDVQREKELSLKKQTHKTHSSNE
jgi:predicted PurR-regulated permease PerM